MDTLTILQVTLSTLVEGCLIPLVAIFGTLGNMASISVLRDKNLDMKQTFRSEICLFYSTKLPFKHGYNITKKGDHTLAIITLPNLAFHSQLSLTIHQQLFANLNT